MEIISLIVLVLCCAIALTRPIWGIAILLIFRCSLFRLDRYVTVPLGIGYAGPGDVLILGILIGGWWYFHRRQRQYRMQGIGGMSLGEKSHPEYFSRMSYSKRVLISAIVPYVLWLGIGSLRGIFIWQGTEFWNLAVRYVLSDILPWSLVLTVWLLRDRIGEIVKIIIIVASLTAVVHIAIIFLDQRSLMHAAYWDSSLKYNPQAQYLKGYLEQTEIVRSLPQGVYLMLICMVYCFSRYLVAEPSNRFRGYYLALSLLQLVAISITYTRSLMAYMIAGCSVALFLATRARISERFTLNRALTAGLIIIICFVATTVANPRFSNFWRERIFNFGRDIRIFSADTIRGQDNTAALAVLSDSPILGCGAPQYPDIYSTRERYGTDTHPMLVIGLVGGVMGVLLALRLHFVLFLRFWYASRPNKYLRRALLPYLAIFAMILLVNLSGAGGTLNGKNLISMALFTGLMAIQFAQPCNKNHNQTTNIGLLPKLQIRKYPRRVRRLYQLS